MNSFMKFLALISELPGALFAWLFLEEGDPDDGPMIIQANQCGTASCWSAGPKGFTQGWVPPPCECSVCTNNRRNMQKAGVESIEDILEKLKPEIKVKGVMITLHNPGGFMREASLNYDNRRFVYRGWSHKEALETLLDRVRAHIQSKMDKDSERL